jgi:hypothetical protein
LPAPRQLSTVCITSIGNYETVFQAVQSAVRAKSQPARTRVTSTCGVCGNRIAGVNTNRGRSTDGATTSTTNWPIPWHPALTPTQSAVRPATPPTTPRAAQAARILDVCVRYCHALCKQNGIKPEPIVRQLAHREKRWNRRIVRQFWSYSAREIYALAAKREQKSRSAITAKDWNERTVKPFIRTTTEPPPGDPLRSPLS